MAEVLFQERQYFRQWFVWLPLLGTDVLFLWGLVQQLGMGKPWGDNPMSDLGLVLTSLLVFALTGLFMAMHLNTEISTEGVRIFFFPMTRRFISWDEVEQASVVEYNPLMDYGGWGVRWGKQGRAYNVSGATGIELLLKDGKKVMIGTRRGAELPLILHKARQG
ncbi:MAG: hypothetical protein WA004_07700 [Saprospiraceae bacterium]